MNEASAPDKRIQQIKHWSGRVLFECDIPEHVESGMAVRHALEKATREGKSLRDADLSGAVLRDAVLSGAVLRGADLRGAVLRGADLRGADLRDADLSGAVLSDAVLRGADLRGADLSGAVLSDAVLSGAVLRDENGAPLRATPEEAVANLDKVREIVLDSPDRLYMGHWHGDYEWKQRTCAEETLCGTTHCLAGWLQVCSTKPELRAMDAELAGILAAPVAAKMFYRSDEEAREWLEKRQYATELGLS